MKGIIISIQMGGLLTIDCELSNKEDIESRRINEDGDVVLYIGYFGIKGFLCTQCFN